MYKELNSTRTLIQRTTTEAPHGKDLPAGILDAIADRFLVNIQADVIHTFRKQ